MSLGQDCLQTSRQGDPSSQPPPSLVAFQEKADLAPHLRLTGGGLIEEHQGKPKSPLPVPKTNLREFAGGEPHQRRVQHCQQRMILQRVIQQLQQVQEITNLDALVESVTLTL